MTPDPVLEAKFAAVKAVKAMATDSTTSDELKTIALAITFLAELIDRQQTDSNLSNSFRP